MMRYVHDNHLTEYEWFLRLDDDAYVHIEHLESLLRRINSSDSLYIGSPGFGRDNDDFVEDNMVYCMGGPGVGKGHKRFQLFNNGFHCFITHFYCTFL